MKKWAMMAMLALTGCMSIDFNSRLVREDVEIEETGRHCNVEQVSSEQTAMWDMERRGLVLMASSHFSYSTTTHSAIQQMMDFGRKIGAVEARWYKINTDYDGFTTTYDCRVLFFGKPKKSAANEKVQEPEEKAEEEQECNLCDLEQAVQMDYHPEQGAVFVHDGRRLRVVQTFAEGEEINGVMVYPVLAAASAEDALVGARFEVVSAYRYCNMEYLRPGLYRYAGTDSYTTKEDVINTVRVFAELPQEESKGE